MNQTRASRAAYQRSVWLAYVSQDPDLRQLEAEKRNTYHRRVVKMYHKTSQTRRARNFWAKTGEAAAMAAAGFAVVAAVSLMLVCL